jgi:predicted HAD superfamily phosphohydrolase YqeG
MDEDKENCLGIGDEMILGAVLAGFSAGAMCVRVVWVGAHANANAQVMWTIWCLRMARY